MTNPGGDAGQTPSPESNAGATELSAGGYEAPPIEASQQPQAYAPPPPPMPPQFAPPGYPPPPGPTPGYPPPYGAAAPGFGAPGYGYGGQPAGTNNLAIASLVLSAIGVFCGIGSIVGIVLGIISLNQIKASGQGGRGLAIAGIVVGAASMVFGSIVYAIMFSR